MVTLLYFQVMSVAFSSKDDIIDRDQAQVDHVEIDDYLDCFEVVRCVEWIRKGEFQRVTLQFPDELLTHGPSVSSLIESRLQQK